MARDAIVTLFTIVSVTWSFVPEPLVAQTSEELELHAIRTIPVPVDFTIRGAVILRDDQFLLWSPTGLLLISADDSHRSIAYDVDIDPRGLRVVQVDPLTVEIADAQTSGLVVVDSAGRIERSASLPLERELLQAVALEEGWILYTNTSDATDPRLWHYVSDHPAHRLDLTRSQENANASDPMSQRLAPLRLSSGGATVLVTEINNPYHTWRVDSESEPEVRLIPASTAIANEAAAQRFPLNVSVALPVLELDRGIVLHQLSDLSRDRRMIGFLAEDTLTRVRTLDFSIGFLASNPAARLLVAVRDTGSQDIVVYRWRWSGVEATIQQEEMT